MARDRVERSAWDHPAYARGLASLAESRQALARDEAEERVLAQRRAEAEQEAAAYRQQKRQQAFEEAQRRWQEYKSRQEGQRLESRAAGVERVQRQRADRAPMEAMAAAAEQEPQRDQQAGRAPPSHRADYTGEGFAAYKRSLGEAEREPEQEARSQRPYLPPPQDPRARQPQRAEREPEPAPPTIRATPTATAGTQQQRQARTRPQPQQAAPPTPSTEPGRSNVAFTPEDLQRVQESRQRPREQPEVQRTTPASTPASTPEVSAQSRAQQEPSAPQAGGETPDFLTGTPEGRKWEEVRRSPVYNGLSREEQAKVRERYFNRFVLPKVPLQQAGEVRAGFEGQTEPSVSNRLSQWWRDTREIVTRGDEEEGAPQAQGRAPTVREEPFQVMEPSASQMEAAQEVAQQRGQQPRQGQRPSAGEIIQTPRPEGWTPQKEGAFRKTYARWAQEYDLPKDPDAASLTYDYRAMWESGRAPSPREQGRGAFPDEFRREAGPAPSTTAQHAEALEDYNRRMQGQALPAEERDLFEGMAEQRRVAEAEKREAKDYRDRLVEVLQERDFSPEEAEQRADKLIEMRAEGMLPESARRFMDARSGTLLDAAAGIVEMLRARTSSTVNTVGSWVSRDWYNTGAGKVSDAVGQGAEVVADWVRDLRPATYVAMRDRGNWIVEDADGPIKAPDGKRYRVEWDNVTPESISGTVGESLGRSADIIIGGGLLKRALSPKVGEKAATALAYGLANATSLAPESGQEAADIVAEYGRGLEDEEGNRLLSDEEVARLRAEASRRASAQVGAVSGVTGALGAAPLAAGRGMGTRIAATAATEAATEIPEEMNQQLAEELERTRITGEPINWQAIYEAGAKAGVAGAATGVGEAMVEGRQREGRPAEPEPGAPDEGEISAEDVLGGEEPGAPAGPAPGGQVAIPEQTGPGRPPPQPPGEEPAPEQTEEAATEAADAAAEEVDPGVAEPDVPPPGRETPQQQAAGTLEQALPPAEANQFRVTVLAQLRRRGTPTREATRMLRRIESDPQLWRKYVGVHVRNLPTQSRDDFMQALRRWQGREEEPEAAAAESQIPVDTAPDTIPQEEPATAVEDQAPEAPAAPPPALQAEPEAAPATPEEPGIEAPPEPAPEAQREPPQTVVQAADRLQGARTMAEAQEAVPDTFTKGEIIAVARNLDVPVRSRESKAALRERVIESGAGARIRSEAVQTAYDTAPAVQPEQRTDVRPVEEPDSRVDTRPDARPEARPDARPDARTQAEPTGRPTAQPEPEIGPGTTEPDVPREPGGPMEPPEDLAEPEALPEAPDLEPPRPAPPKPDLPQPPDQPEGNPFPEVGEREVGDLWPLLRPEERDDVTEAARRLRQDHDIPGPEAFMRALPEVVEEPQRRRQIRNAAPRRVRPALERAESPEMRPQPRPGGAPAAPTPTDVRGPQGVEAGVPGEQQRPPEEAPRAERAEAVPGTPAFEQWFAGSQVLDANGDPMQVGMPAPGRPDRVDPQRARERMPKRAEHFGFVFRDMAEATAFFSEEDLRELRQTRNVRPAYLRIERPWTLQSDEEVDTWLDEGGHPAVADTFAEQGYDGLRVISNERLSKRGFAPVNWVAFDPDQVRYADPVAEAEADADTQPSEAQKRAGNYKKGHTRLQGFEVSIETPAGATRSGTDPQGRAWEVALPHPYGYIRGTRGRDGDALDVFIGPNPDSSRVFVVDQINPETRRFDEHKVLMGFETRAQAERAYQGAYEEGWEGNGGITEFSVEEFRDWVENAPKTARARGTAQRFRRRESPEDFQRRTGRQPTRLPDEVVAPRPSARPGERASDNLYQQALAGGEPQTTAETAEVLRGEVDRMLGEGVEVAFADAMRAKGMRVDGLYNRDTNRITINLQSRRAREATFHEAMHWARDNLLTPEENAALDRDFAPGAPYTRAVEDALKRDAAASKHDLIDRELGDVEERVAYAFGRWATGQLSFGGRVRSAFQKIWRGLVRMVNRMRGRSTSPNTEEIFEALRSGEMAGRTPAVTFTFSRTQRELMETQAREAAQRPMADLGPPQKQREKSRYLRPAGGWAKRWDDFIFQVPHELAPVHRLYGYATEQLDTLLEEGKLTQDAYRYLKAGVVDRYGQDERSIAAHRALYGRIRRGTRMIQTLVGRMEVTREESRVAYNWLQAKPNTQREQDLLGKLPAEQRQNLQEIKKTVRDLGREMVRLGHLSEEAFQRNEMAYLHRTYARHELGEDGRITSQRQRARRILGDQYKGRGMYDRGFEIGRIAKHAPGWVQRFKGRRGEMKGEKFLRLVRRRSDGQVAERAYVPRGAVPDKMLDAQGRPGNATWDLDRSADGQPHLWEAIDVRDKAGSVTMWRDFSPAERETMGEIDEAKYAVTRTLLNMVHDVEMARYFEWVAGNPDYTRDAEADLPADARPVQATESLARPYLPNEWVQVPDTPIPRTGGVKKYGALAGKWISGPMWNDIRQQVNHDPGLLHQWFDATVRAFKISKTALTPTTHVNNIAANVVLMEIEDIGVRHVMRALYTYARHWKGDMTATQVIEEFEDVGAGFGTYAAQELRSKITEPLLDQLREEVGLAAREGGAETMLDKVRALTVVENVLWGGRKAVETGINVYQFEDNMFRLAAYLKAREAGATPEEAGQRAVDAFLDYDINAPWVAMARKTALPFISFTYRIAPKLHRTVRDKPWKLSKIATVITLLSAAGYALSGGDEEEERRLMPERRGGKLWGIIPRMVRWSWNHGEKDNPIFWDITRFIPGGDMFLFSDSNSVVPISPTLQVGGPAQWFIEFVSNTDMYTGEKIALETDTNAERAGKFMFHLYRNFVPNFVLIPRSYAWEQVGMLRGVPGIGAESYKVDPFGREYPLTYKILNAFGFKIAPYPLDTMRMRAVQRTESRLRDYNRQLYEIGRLYQREAITRSAYEQRFDEIQERMKREATELRIKLRGPKAGD